MQWTMNPMKKKKSLKSIGQKVWESCSLEVNIIVNSAT